MRRATHPLAALPPDRVGRVVAELIRLVVPAASGDAHLPPPDGALAKALEGSVPPEARARLADVAGQVLAQSRQEWEQLSFAMRETAERTALVLCGDPGDTHLQRAGVLRVGAESRRRASSRARRRGRPATRPTS